MRQLSDKSDKSVSIFFVELTLINVSSMNLQLLSIPLFLPWANVNARELSVN